MRETPNDLEIQIDLRLGKYKTSVEYNHVKTVNNICESIGLHRFEIFPNAEESINNSIKSNNLKDSLYKLKDKINNESTDVRAAVQ
jgi:hypothetical protein